MRTKIYLLVILGLVLFIFNEWFSFNNINSGDFISSSISSNFFPFAWGNALSGMGGPVYSLLWSNFVLGLPLFFLTELLKISPLFSYKFFFYGYLFFSILFPSILFRKLFPGNKFYILASFIFLFNTYALMLVGGGQIFIALSMSLMPLCLFSFIKVLDLKNFNSFNWLNALVMGFSLGIPLTFQLMLDLRIGYIFILSLIAFLIMYNFFYKQKRIAINTFFLLLGSLITVFILNFYWIFPLGLIRQNPIEQLGTAYSSSGGVVFFSFAKIEDTISLLHPNWPENIFGKVYFLKPEFLILPFFAFFPLLFLPQTKKEKFYLLYFSLLALIGIFLAKGANDPFGVFYIFLFNHFPGMQMFRDPTKFYTLIVLSYSMLIPFSIYIIFRKIKSIKFKYLKLQNFFIVAFILYLLFLIRPAFFGNLTGTFRQSPVPVEYSAFNSFINSQQYFFRTFWIPVSQRFTVNTNLHPRISYGQFFNDYNLRNISKNLNQPGTKEKLEDAGVKYVIIPYDSTGEIFLNDRKYSEKEYRNVVNQVSKITWLKEVKGYGKIRVFEVPNPKEHFWLSGEGTLRFKYISPVQYRISLENVRKGDSLVFSESFDKNWVVIDDKNEKSSIRPIKYKIFNSFILPNNGNFDLIIYYHPQTYVNIGLIVSAFFLVALLVIIAIKSKKRIIQKSFK